MLQPIVPIHIRSPLELFVISGVIFAVLWFLAPIDFVFSGNIYSVLLIIVFEMFFALGLFFGFRRWRSAKISLRLSEHRIRRFVHFLALFGFLGLALRLFERIFLRAGGGITANFMVNRELIGTGGSGILAFIGGVLATFTLFLPLGVILLGSVGDKRWRYKVLVLFSLAYPASDILLQGSRSSLAIFASLFILSIATVKRQRIRFRWITIMLFAGIFFIWLGGQIFALRASQAGIDPVDSMSLSGYAHFAPASEEVIYYLDEEGLTGFGGMVYAYVHLCQYFLHGIYEVFYLAANVSGPITWGAQSFYIPLKVIFSLSGGRDVDALLTEGVLRPGIFTTLWGPFIYDFGPLGGALVIFVFGFLSGAVARSVRRGNSALMPLYLVIVSFLPFSFVVNLFVLGTGQYILIGALLLAFFLSRRRFRLISVIPKERCYHLQ